MLIYLWPVLLGGKVLSPVELLSTYAPWRGIPAPGAADLVNPALFDIPTSFQPWRELARDLVHDGTFPAWNPYALAGTPLFGNPEVAWLSPFTLLSWLLPLNSVARLRRGAQALGGGLWHLLAGTRAEARLLAGDARRDQLRPLRLQRRLARRTGCTSRSR